MYELVQYGALASLCTYIVLTYAAPSVSVHVKFWSILTWTLNFGMCLLVPQDVYITMSTNQAAGTLPSPADAEGFPYQKQTDRIMFEYLLLYWSVYLLTWTIIPVLQEWENSGDLLSKDRLKRSLRVNGIFYVYMLVGGLVILGILYYFNVGGDMGLKTYLKCLATCWGILLQVVMMGYSMVEIPRSLWLSGEPKRYLLYCYDKVRELEEQIESTLFEFKQIAAYIIYSKNSQPQDAEIQKYCEASLSIVPPQLQPMLPTVSYKEFLSHLDYVNNYPLGLESSIEHHRLMKRVLARHRRHTKNLEQFVLNAILYEDICDGMSSDSRELDSLVARKNCWNSLWYLKLAPVFYKSLAVMLSILSLLILIAETQLFLTSDNRSILGWLLHFQNLEVVRVLIYVIIIYISYMVYYSLFRIKLSNLYGLYKHESDGPSLMFATINFSRVAFAIVLNFFQMLKLDGIYVKAMGTVDMGLLGEWVIKGIPGALWLIVLCHYYDFWGKIITKFSLSEDLRFATHQVDASEQGGSKASIPFLVRKKRIQLKAIQSTLETSMQERLI